MVRSFCVGLIVVGMASGARAQGPIQRAGQALDRAGKNIRRDVETAVARGQISAQERELLGRVSQRLSFDKALVNSALRLTVRADGAVILQGSIPDNAAHRRAVDLAQSTLGVTAVVDELAVVKETRVIEVVPPQVIVVPPVETRVVVPPATPAPAPVVVPPAGPEVVVPGDARGPVKP